MPSDVAEPNMSPDEIEGVRQRVRLAMSERKLTGTEVARQSGVAYGTWSSWFGGTYKGRNAHVAEQTQHWLNGLEAHERTRALAPRAPAFVPTPTAETFLATLEHAQHMPEFVVITGTPGIGKTSAARWYAARNPNVWMLTAQPSLSSPRALLDKLGDALSVQERGLASIRVSDAISRKMSGSGGLALIDEAQHLSSQTLDELRTFHDLAGIGIALLGNAAVYSRLEGGTRAAHYAQLFSRVGMRVHRKRALAADIDKLLDAWTVQGKSERRLLHAIANKPGALRNLTKTLRLAHMLAGGEGAEQMGESHIQLAWERIGSTANVVPEAE